MNGCVIPHTPISVDCWRIRNNPNAKVFFLTHLHGDHIAGLTPTWSLPIYCTPVTKALLVHKLQICKDLINALEVNTEHTVWLDEEESEMMTVTVLDAHHCPGAAMFLFQGYFGTILHTGDFRFSDQMFINTPLSVPPSVDVLYLDNTYSSAGCEFPTRQHATEQIFDILDSHPGHDVLVGMYTLGKEDLLVAMALHMRTWVVVLQEQYEVLSILDMPNVFTTNVEMGHIHVVPMRRVSATLRRWNRQRPSIAIIPTALHYGSSGIQNTTGNVYVVPYSDHSCYSELKRFVKKVRPRKILPIVSANARGPRGEDISGRADMSCYKKYMDPQDVVPFKVPATVEAYMARHTTIGVRRFKKRKCSATIYHYVNKAKLAKHRQGVQFEDMDDNVKEHTPKREKGESDTKTAIILSKTTKLQQNAIKWHLIPIDIPQNQRKSAWNSIKDPHSYFKNVCIKPDDVSSCPAVELDSRQEIKESAVEQNTVDAIKEAHLSTSSHHTGDNAMVFEGVPSTATCQDVIQSEPKRCNANYCTGLKPTKHSDSTPCMSVPFPIHSCIGIQDECVTGQRDSDNDGSGRLVYEQGSGKTITTSCTHEKCNIGIVANGEIVGSTRNEENNKTCVETSTSLLVLAPEDRQSNLTVNSLKQDVFLEYEDLTDKPNATSQSQFQLKKIKLDPVLLESNNAEDQMSMEEKNPDNGIVLSSVASVCDQLASDICLVTQKARELSLKVDQSVLNKTLVTDPQMALSKMLEIDHSDDSSLAKQCRINSSHVAICVSTAQPPGLAYGDVLLNSSKNGGNPSITSGMPRDLTHISLDTPSTSHQSADTSHSDGLCSLDIDTQPSAVQKRLSTIDVNTLKSLLLSHPASNENLVDPNDNMGARIVQAHPVAFTAGNTIRTGGTALPTSQIIDPAPEAVSQELKQLTSDLQDRINEHLHNTCRFSENQEDACSPSDDVCQTETIAISEKLELEMNRNNAEYGSSNSGAGTSIRHSSATLQNKASHSEKYVVWGPKSGISNWHLRGKKGIYDPRRVLCEDSVDLPGRLTLAGTALCQSNQCNQDNREKDMAHKKQKGFPKGKPLGSRSKQRSADNNIAKSNEKQIKLVIKLGKAPKSLFQPNDHSNRSYWTEKTEMSSNCGECETGLSPSPVNENIPEMLANNCPSWGADYRELTSLDAHVLVPPQLSVPSPNNNTIDVINNGEFIPLDNIEESYIFEANDINVALCQMSSTCDEELCSCKTHLVSQRLDEEKEQFGEPQNGRQSLIHSNEYIGHENITASGNTDSQTAEQHCKSSEQIYNKQQYSPSENSVQDCCNMICSAPCAVNAPSIMASPKQVATLQDIISESFKLSLTATVSGTPSISALKKANISIPTWASSPCLSQLGTVCSKLSPTLLTSTITLSLVGSTNSTTLPVSNITDPLLDEVAVASTPLSQTNSPQQLSVCSSVPPVLHIVTAAPSPVADTNLTPLPVSNITDSPLDEVYVASTPPSQANSPQQLSVCSSLPPALHTFTSAPSPVDDTNLTPLPLSNITDPPLGEISVASTSPSEANSPQQLSVCSSVPPALHIVTAAPSPVADTNLTPLPVSNIIDSPLDEVSVASTLPSEANSPQQLSVCSSVPPALHTIAYAPSPVDDTNSTPLPVSNVTDLILDEVSVASTPPSQANSPQQLSVCSSVPPVLHIVTAAPSPVADTNLTPLPVSNITDSPLDDVYVTSTPPSQANSPQQLSVCSSLPPALHTFTSAPSPVDDTNLTPLPLSNITDPPLGEISVASTSPSEANSPQQLSVCSSVPPALHIVTAAPSPVADPNLTRLPVSNIIDSPLDEVSVASTSPSEANSPQQLSVCSSVPPALHTIAYAPSPVDDTNSTPLPVGNVTDLLLDEVYVASTPPSQANSPQQLSVCSSVPPVLHIVTAAPSPVADTNLTPLPVSNITDSPLDGVYVTSTPPSQANSPQQLSVCSSMPPALHIVTAAPPPVADTNLTPLPVSNFTDSPLGNISVPSTQPSQENTPSSSPMGVGCSSLPPALYTITGALSPVGSTNYTLLPVRHITSPPLSETSVPSTTPPSQANSLFPAPLDSTNCTLLSVSNITTPPLHETSSVPSAPSLQRSAPSITLPPISAHSSPVQATISFMPSPQSSVTSTAQSPICDKQPHKSSSHCSQASYMIHVSSDGSCAKSWVSRPKERGSLLITSQPMRTSSGEESRGDMANPSIDINNEIDLVSNDVNNGGEANNNRCEADLRNSNDQPYKSDVDNLLAYGSEWSLLKKNQSETGHVDGDNCELASNLVVGSNVRETFLTGMDTTLQKGTSKSIVQCEGPLQSMPDRFCVCVVTSGEQPMPILCTQRKKRRLRTLSVSKVVCTSVGEGECEEDCNDVCITGEGFKSLLLMTNRHWSMISHSYSHSRYNDFTEKTQCRTLPLIQKKNSSQKVMARKVPLHIEIQGAKYAKKQERRHVNKQGSILRYVVPNKGKPGTCFPDSVWHTKDSDIKMTLPISGQQHSARKGSSSKSNPRVVRPSTEDLGQSVLQKQTLVSTGEGKFGSVKSVQRLGASSKDETRAKMCTNGDEAELLTRLRSSSGELVKRVERLRVNSMNRTTQRATLSGHRLLREWKPNEGLRMKQSDEAGVTTLCTEKGNLNLVNSSKPKQICLKPVKTKLL